MSKKEQIIVQGVDVAVVRGKNGDYISLTDMAKAKQGEARAADIIKNWIRTRTALEFIGTWEQIYNPEFKVVEFDHFKMGAGLPSFTLSVGEWVERTRAIGIVVKSGRCGGTYAHKDIAFEFGAAISTVFKLFLIKEFQRLKEDETRRAGALEWDLQRTLSKINYRIHTDAIKEHIVPEVTRRQVAQVYASEADLLNVALFGQTAAQWRTANPGEKGNIRDGATIEQLVVLSNLESINALLIEQAMPQGERLVQLNATAITQMRSLTGKLDNLKI